MVGASEETSICGDEEMRSEHTMQACKLELKFQRQEIRYPYIAISIENDLSFSKCFSDDTIVNCKPKDLFLPYVKGSPNESLLVIRYEVHIKYWEAKAEASSLWVKFIFPACSH